MKGISKKIIGALLIVAFAFVGFLTTSKPAYAAEGDVARIVVSDTSWGIYYWGASSYTEGVTAVTPLVEDYGSYTASVDFSGVTGGVLPDIVFLGLEIVNGETNIPNNFIRITSFTVDDGVSEDPVDISYSGTYVNNEWDNGVDIHRSRLNLYNTFGAAPQAGDRTLYGSANVSAIAVNPADFENIVSIEISFDVVDGVPYNDTPVAYLNYASSDWSINHWYDGNDYSPVVAVIPEVTAKNAQYTASLDFSGTTNGMAQGVAFMDIEILNGELAYPGSFMQIDEVAINGTPVSLDYDTYTSSDNEFDTRTNLYNAWASSFVSVGRTADATYDNISPVPLDSGLFVDVVTISVTFTLLDGMDIGSTPLPAEGTTGYLQFQNDAGDVSYWVGSATDITHTDAVITGFGQYTASLDFSTVTGGSVADIAFLNLEITGGELYFPYNIVTIDEVQINGAAVILATDTYTEPLGDDTRVNLYNAWSNLSEDARLADGVVAEDASYLAIDVAAIVDPITSISVTFTINRGELPEPEAPYEMPENFKAFMMYSSEEGGWQRYDPELDTAGDAIITGDGTWTVYIDSTFGNAGSAVTGAAVTPQVFLIDIIDFGNAMESVGTLDGDGAVTAEDFAVSIQVWVDDVEISVTQENILYGDIEGNGRFRIEIYNIWGAGTADDLVVNPANILPTSEIKVTFTISGTGVDLSTGYDVTFDSDGGSAVAAQNVEDGAMASEPADPTKEGYTFVEWQLDGSAYDFSSAVTADIELVAVWEEVIVAPDMFDVTFDSDGGSSVAAQSVEDGDMASEPADPTKEGYTFVEWQLDGSAYDFSSAVTADIELVAVWEMDEVPVDETGCNSGCASEFALTQVAIVSGLGLTLLGSLAYFFIKKKY